MKFSSKFILIAGFLIGFLSQIIAMEKPASFNPDRHIFYDFGRRGLARNMRETSLILRDRKLFIDNKLISLSEFLRTGNLSADQLKHYYIEEPSGDFTPLRELIDPQELKNLSDPALMQSQTQLQVSNQTDQNAKVWLVTKTGGKSTPETIASYQDSSSIKPLLDSYIFIESLAGTYSIFVHPSNDLSLYTPKDREKKGIPPRDAQDILVTISPDGSVDFTKRNR